MRAAHVPGWGRGVFVGAWIAAATLGGCQTSPLGRRQLVILPDAQMNAMGVQAFDELKAKTPSETSPAILGYVSCVALAVAAESTDDTGVKSWEVVVFKDDTANAFALPGGKIGVHTGLLKVAVTPGQLAAVLGHEVGHVIARHGAERVSEAGLMSAGLAVTGGLIKNPKTRDLALAALGAGAQFGVLLPHSRTQESEADGIGLGLMARAGFDPRESVELWKNMSKAGGGQPPEFLSTHPSHETRIQGLEAGMEGAGATYREAVAGGREPKCSAG